MTKIHAFALTFWVGTIFAIPAHSGTPTLDSHCQIAPANKPEVHVFSFLESSNAYSRIFVKCENGKAKGIQFVRTDYSLGGMFHTSFDYLNVNAKKGNLELEIPGVFDVAVRLQVSSDGQRLIFNEENAYSGIAEGQAKVLGGEFEVSNINAVINWRLFYPTQLSAEKTPPSIPDSQMIPYEKVFKEIKSLK